ncbi:MAG TPA: metallophosphoesterase [Thermoleophilaceae bacterium]|nr:metallophosphoesterase [Thermoleophilaceae bacterium]
MAAVATAIVSDLHLGTVSGADLARRPRVLERLLAVADEADRLVVLGDLLELRERPATAVLDDVASALSAIGDVTAGKPVVLVPGNHDHQLVAPALERERLAGVGPLAVAGEHPPRPGDLADRVAGLMPRSELTVAYPGVWLRDDVYATHGHYLDAHLTVPRVECLVAAGVERLGTRIGPDGPTSATDYEAIFTPMYALSHAIAQNARSRPATRRNNLSRRVWTLATDSGGSASARLRGQLVGRAAIPAAVAAINALGLGPFKPDISAEELRRAGLAAIGEVVGRLGVGADHVVFGHTHRAGPLPSDPEGDWTLPSGGRLTNSGSWVDEDVFLDGDGAANPYWPGRVVWLDESGPPRLETALDTDDLATTRA